MYIEHMPYFDKIEGRRKFDGKGKLESKGMETKRRDSCVVAKKAIYGFGKRLLRISMQGRVEEAKQQATAYVKAMVTKINTEGVPFHQLIQARKVTSSAYKNQNMPHLHVARWLETQGKPVSLGTRITFVIVTGRKNIKRYQAAVDPDRALLEGLQPDLKYVIDTKIFKPIQRFLKWFGDEGLEMLEDIFGSQFKVHKSNVLEEDGIARFVKPMLPCMVCGDDSFDRICGGCRGDANFWKILEERRMPRFKLQQAYDARLKVCRACMHITEAEEVVCANSGCLQYFPRRTAEYDLYNFDKTTQEIQDIEDTVPLKRVEM